MGVRYCSFMEPPEFPAGIRDKTPATKAVTHSHLTHFYQFWDKKKEKLLKKNDRMFGYPDKRLYFCSELRGTNGYDGLSAD